MFKFILLAVLPFLLFLGESADTRIVVPLSQPVTQSNGVLEKLVVSDGVVAFDLDSAIFGGGSEKVSSRNTSVKFTVSDENYFTVIVLNDELRGSLPSSMKLVPKNRPNVPESLAASIEDLVFESQPWGGHDLVVRDQRKGTVLFYVEGAEIEYIADGRTLTISSGRLMVTEEFALSIGRPDLKGRMVGTVSVAATMKVIEVNTVDNGEITSTSLPPTRDPEVGTVPGPDVVVGDVNGLQQMGSSSGTQVGLALGTDSCNFGTVDLNWLQNPNNDHPVIPQNLYRMSGGASGSERFEQIGQSSLKHAFTALTDNICGLGCNNVGGSRLGSGCSDPYTASLNGSQSGLGSRAWVNPFSGFFPRNDSATPNNTHSGHTHVGPSHRILTEINDLNTSLNSGATYYAEGQYVTPHEYAHCQANPTQCNMYNNVSYRRYTVSGTASPFSFSAAASTVRMKAAISAWTDSTAVDFAPAPGTDGVGTVAYKVTQTSPGVWHYEYAVYNQNIDRAIQSFSVPTGAGVTISNIGSHAPPQHPGWAGDGTTGGTGFSSASWTQSQTGGSMTWSSETLAQNPNANAIRWGTLYNFRFDSNRPPTTMNATIGFLKTGGPINVQIQGPSSTAAANATVSGRVTSSNGRGIGGARVSINGTGVARIAITNSFGYYAFENVPTGSMYSISPSAKRFSFTPQNLLISDNVNGVNFVALP